MSDKVSNRMTSSGGSLWENKKKLSSVALYYMDHNYLNRWNLKLRPKKMNKHSLIFCQPQTKIFHSTVHFLEHTILPFHLFSSARFFAISFPIGTNFSSHSSPWIKTSLLVLKDLVCLLLSNSTLNCFKWKFDMSRTRFSRFCLMHFNLGKSSR